MYKEETYVKALKRVCDFVASVENTDKLKKYWSERWFDEIYNDWWHPAGSIMQGAGSGKKVSLSNCTHVDMGKLQTHQEWDNLESIIKNTAYKVAKYAAYRQGLGVAFNRLRPKLMTVQNSSQESSGSTHWMKFIDSIGYFVGQKGRIPAMLFSQDIKHPDIIDFINIKSDYTQIQNANISVQVTSAFYDAVEKDDEWTMFFEIPETKVGDKIYVDHDSMNIDCEFDPEKKQHFYICQKARAKEYIECKERARFILELIAKNMFYNAEPGIQNIDIAKYWSNSDYVYDENAVYDSRIVGTNACSEQYLSPDSCCVLASQNAGKFSVDPNQYEEELSIIAESINRFLDNVNECEVKYHTYATPQQRIAIESLRRTGAGYTNLVAWLFKQNLEYGTPDGNDAIDKFTERYNFYLYKSSINLGKEKGNFKLFNQEKLQKSPFIQHMMDLGLKFETLRNITCSSIAPTGTLSLMFRETLMSYGIEPAFGLYWWKRTRISGKYEYYFCVPDVVFEVFRKYKIEIPLESTTIKDTWDGKIGKQVAEFIDQNVQKIGLKFKGATKISPFDKLDLMSRVMKNIDSSISVTYLLPEDTKVEDVYDFILSAHKKGVKSIAAFPDKQMYGIVSFIPFKDLAKKLLSQGIQIHNQNFSKDEITQLGQAVEKSNERPKALQCDIHHVKVTKKLDKIRTFDYLVLVGLKDEAPYEVFAKENGDLDKKIKQGQIVKSGGKYNLIYDNNTIVENLTKDTTTEEDALTRLTSTLLRFDVDVAAVVDQLEKVEGDLLCFARAISRSLKKYIKDGTPVVGQKCENCGNSSLVRMDGCVSCSCGWTKCN